ncbi:MAG: hypothetical protein JST44_14290 [Cyanobacteria bacterium SZAS LIN-5]|nr:hypothetical protein [Cyanobacteria bacterium SZAS LIN-5]
MHLELQLERAARRPVLPRPVAAVTVRDDDRDESDDPLDLDDLDELAAQAQAFSASDFSQSEEVEAALEDESFDDGLETQLALQVPYVPIAEHYALGLVYDRGQTESIVRQDLLNKWDMQFSEALGIAFANLSEISSYPFELVAPGVYMAPPGLDHNPAKLLLTDKVANLRLKGMPVAIVPHANQVVISGSEDILGLKLLLKISKDLTSAPGGSMALPMVLSENNWYPFSLPGDHELFDQFDRMRLSVMSTMYAEQKAFLQKIYARSETPYSVIDYLERSDGEYNFSQSIINEQDLPALIPLADSLEFRKAEENMPLKRVANGNLDKCVKSLSDLLHAAGLYPERCRLEKFPDKKQLRSIGLDGFKSAYEKYIEPAADPKRVVEDTLLLPIYPNSRPKGDSREYQGRYSMDFLSTDQTALVSKFYFDALNKSVSTAVFNFHLSKTVVVDPYSPISQNLMNQMLAAHYKGRAPDPVMNAMPTPDTYVLLDETQTISRSVSLIRAQHNGTVIILSKKAHSEAEIQLRSALPINDADDLTQVFNLPIHQALTPVGACLNETHAQSQLFSVVGASLQEVSLFYLAALKQSSYLTATSSQYFIEAVKPVETISVHLGKGIAGEQFLQLKRVHVSNKPVNVKKTEQLLDLEKRLGVELYAESVPDGRLFIKDKVFEQKFVSNDNPQAVARFFRCVIAEPVFIPMEDYRPNCWLVQSIAGRKAGESISVLVLAGAERTVYVVRTIRV